MSTVYIHIGYPKTATTSIQKFLIDNRHYLYDLGYHYPLTGIVRRSGTYQSPARYGHSNLSWELAGLSCCDSHAGSWAELVRELNALRPENVILSNEGFAMHNNQNKLEQIALIKDYLSCHEVKIVVYLRRQDRWIESFYSQFVKASRLNSSTIKEFVSQQSELLNYYDAMIKWAEVFGENNIIVRDFDKEKKHGIYQSFLEAINLKLSKADFEKFNIEKTKNISPTIKSIHVLILYNDLFVKTGLIPKRFARLIGFKVFIENSLIQHLIAMIPDIILPNELLSQNDKDELMAKYQAGNRLIAQKFLGDDQHSLFD